MTLKDKFITAHIESKMKGIKLPFGMQYLSILASAEEKAEQEWKAYKKLRKQNNLAAEIAENPKETKHTEQKYTKEDMLSFAEFYHNNLNSLFYFDLWLQRTKTPSDSVAQYIADTIKQRLEDVKQKIKEDDKGYIFINQQKLADG